MSEKMTFMDRAGIFEAEIVDCYFRESRKGWIQVTEYRVDGKPRVWVTVEPVPRVIVTSEEERERCKLRPQFKPGEKLRLETKRISGRSGISFTHHRWARAGS